MRVKCCRSLPRCGDCPVVVAARARAAGRTGGAEALVALALEGGPPRELPACVAEALAGIEALRPAPTVSSAAPPPALLAPTGT